MFFCWYCLGLIPTLFLNVLLKWDRLLNPCLSAGVFHGVAIGQQFFGFGDAAVDDVLAGGGSHDIPESFAQGIFVYEEAPGQGI